MIILIGFFIFYLIRTYNPKPKVILRIQKSSSSRKYMDIILGSIPTTNMTSMWISTQFVEITPPPLIDKNRKVCLCIERNISITTFDRKEYSMPSNIKLNGSNSRKIKKWFTKNNTLVANFIIKQDNWYHKPEIRYSLQPSTPPQNDRIHEFADMTEPMFIFEPEAQSMLDSEV